MLVERSLVILDLCPTGEGAWFDKGELDGLDESVWTALEAIEVIPRDPPVGVYRCRIRRAMWPI